MQATRSERLCSAHLTLRAKMLSVCTSTKRYFTEQENRVQLFRELILFCIKHLLLLSARVNLQLPESINTQMCSWKTHSDLHIKETLKALFIPFQNAQLIWKGCQHLLFCLYSERNKCASDLENKGPVDVFYQAANMCATLTQLRGGLRCPGWAPALALGNVHTSGGQSNLEFYCCKFWWGKNCLCRETE